MPRGRSHLHFRAPSNENERSMVISGDCVIPDTPRRDSLPFGDRFLERIHESDLSFINLEAPITDEPTPLRKSGPTIHSASDSPRVFAQAGFTGVTLANNHAMDYGERGLLETLRSCSDHGLSTVGAGRSTKTAMEPLVHSFDEVDVTVFNMCEREFGIAGEDHAGTAWLGDPAVRERIEAAAKKSDIVVVIAHGGIEYVPLPPPHLQARFRALIRSGADLVVGHHPHVPQGWEQYENGAIFYSLGNCIFDRSSREKPRWGISLEITFDPSGIHSVELVLTEQDDGRVNEMDVHQRSDRLDHLHRISQITTDRTVLEAHWQAQAVKIFHQRYTNWLTTGVGTGLLESFRTPSLILESASRWDPAKREEALLILLNLVRNESHRAVIQTALETEMGVEPDRRTDQVENTVSELLLMTEDKSLDRRSTHLGRLTKAISNRVARTFDANNGVTRDR